MNNLNNPFESGNNKQKEVGNQNTIDSHKTLRNKKLNASKLIVFASVIIGVCVIAFITNWTILFYGEENKDYLQTLEEISTLEAVTDYKYNFDDINTDLTTDPFPNPIPKGENYTFDRSVEGGYVEEDYYILETEVGVDIQPGIYTIVNNGVVEIDNNLQLSTYFAYKGGVEYHNVPLVAGDTIKFSFPVDGKNQNPNVSFTAQSEYVNFEPQLNGVFVYGLNQFESELTFDENSYDKIEYRYNLPGSKNGFGLGDIYDQDITLPGSPGSYFAIEYSNA